MFSSFFTVPTSFPMYCHCKGTIQIKFLHFLNCLSDLNTYYSILLQRILFFVQIIKDPSGFLNWFSKCQLPNVFVMFGRKITRKAAWKLISRSLFSPCTHTSQENDEIFMYLRHVKFCTDCLCLGVHFLIFFSSEKEAS